VDEALRPAAGRDARAARDLPGTFRSLALD
jgi:hypothetical protein